MIESPAGPPRPADKVCPRCGDRRSALPAVHVASLGAQISRCLRCGTRTAFGQPNPRWVFSCAACGVPFLADELLSHDAQRCVLCRDGRPHGGLPEAELAAATEAEVRLALRERWRFVGAAGLTSYLDRVGAQIGRHVGGLEGPVRVVLFDDVSFRTLALPSGTLLVSTGTLASLENEAELAFVLGHELAHAASSDAAIRLVRLGLDSIRREGREPGNGNAWAVAVEDLIRAGYGRRRERDADERAVSAMVSAGYDPSAASRLLQRLDDRMRAGDGRLAELATSHPAPLDRIRRLDRMLHGRLRGDEPFRVNREVFRRVAGRDSLVRDLAPIRLDAPEPEAPRDEAARGLPAWVATAAGIGLLATLILLLAFALSR